MNKIKSILGIIILLLVWGLLIFVVYTISIMGDPSSEIKVKIINNSKDNILIKNIDLIDIDRSKSYELYQLKYIPLLSGDTVLVKQVSFVGLISSEDFNYVRTKIEGLEPG